MVDSTDSFEFCPMTNVYVNILILLDARKRRVRQSASHRVQPEYRNSALYSLDLAVRQASSQENPQKVGESVKLEPANKRMTPSRLFVPKGTCKNSLRAYVFD